MSEPTVSSMGGQMSNGTATHFLQHVAACLLVIAAVASSEAIAAERTEVEIKQTVLSDGDVRYSIPISFGGSAAIDVMLDTGSTGIRILPGTLADSTFKTTGKADVYAYSSGVRLNGVVATLPISIGSLASPAPLNVELVKTIDCSAQQPNCPASRLSLTDYRLGGDGLAKQGFSAIVGLSSNPSNVDNPLIQMGVHSWLIELPEPATQMPGKLILNPSADDVAGFTMFPTQAIFRPSAPIHDAVQACLIIKAAKRICGPTLFDTGAPGIHVSASTLADGTGWSKGDAMTIAIADDKGASISANFTAGQDRPSTISASQPAGLPVTHISAGTLPFLLFSVLYDNDSHLVGLKLR